MKGCLYALLALVLIPVAFVAFTAINTGFSPGGIWSSEERDNSVDAASYCAHAVIALRDRGYPGISPQGFPVIKTRGRAATFACAASSPAGGYVVHVRAICGVPDECYSVDLIQDAAGNVLWSAEAGG